ncbi:hypothetical protein GAY28_00220 [Azospirillum brasilense]|nr:hypothetical protein [Azospirillum brasilense]
MTDEPIIDPLLISLRDLAARLNGPDRRAVEDAIRSIEHQKTVEQGLVERVVGAVEAGRAWRERAPLVARDQKSRWLTDLTELGRIGIADALRRDAGIDTTTPEDLEILAVAPALEQAFNMDAFVVAVRAGDRHFALRGREIGWSILSSAELIDEAAALDQAVEMTLAVIHALTQREP